MTPERKKYLDGISVEERLIRKAIKFQKDILWSRKKDLSTIATYPDEFGCPPRITKFAIAETKAVIKTLKKALPAPKEKIELIKGRYYMFVCSACGASTVEGTYCPYCGQKLR